MADDLVENVLRAGMAYGEVVRLLGKPSGRSSSSLPGFGYHVEYGVGLRFSCEVLGLRFGPDDRLEWWGLADT